MNVMKEIVRLEGVWVSYDGMPALEGLSLSINEGDFLGVIGPNGSGKTTFLKVIVGLIKPDRGKVLVMGKSPEKSRADIGYVSQKSFFDHDFPISVWEVVLMGRYVKTGLFRHYSTEDKRIAGETLETVGMREHQNRQIGSLSGGQQQRVFIARALATDPKLLLLDEPVDSVDPVMQTEFYELLEGLRQKMAIVLVSHDISAVSIYVDKIACLNRQLYYHGSKEISQEVLESTYKCPIQLITHGDVPHRVLKEH